tara:strand:+ start:16858 stop:17544 length:687 start_codon:yes stop_codon:yes gene_type:complete
MLKNYNSNIDTLHTFLANELKDSIIIPVLTSNIAINSGNDYYSNFAYSNFELNCNIDSNLESKMTTDLNKSKLKHSIIKNIAYTNEIKTRQSAEDHFNKISNYKLNDIDYQDRITYYVDFVNEFKLLNDVIDDSDTDTTVQVREYAIELKDFIVKETNNKELLKKATETYLGPTILGKYNLIDIVVCCAIIIIAILLYSVKAYVNIYISGILALMFVLIIVFITMIFI